MKVNLSIGFVLTVAVLPVWAQSPETAFLDMTTSLTCEQRKATLDAFQRLVGVGLTEDQSKLFLLGITDKTPQERDEIVSSALDLASQGVAPSSAVLLAQRLEVDKRLAAEEAAKEEAEASAQRKFLGFDWSLGVGLSGDLGGDARVESAEVVDGIVRVTEESSFKPRIVLESHFLFRLGAGTKGKTTGVLKGHGPFVGIQSSGNEVIESFSFGWMLGWRRDPAKSQSFNIGLGPIYDHKVKVLGDGIKANEPLPDGETEVRYKTEGRWGALLMFSFSF